MELAASFVPAADDVTYLQRGEGAECEFFMAIARQGHAGGGMRSQQGIYCFAPGGEFLGSDNTADAARLVRLLKAALSRWGELPRERRLHRAPFPVLPERDFQVRPERALVLRQFSRHLPRELSEQTDWNTGTAWFTSDEARLFLPDKPATGQKHPVPERLVRRLAQFHFIDATQGSGNAFQGADVESATLVAEVLGVRDGRVELKFSGESRTAQKDRGYEPRLLGRAVFDLRGGEFSAFTLAAVGRCWGPYSGTLGVALELASGRPGDRLAPAFHCGYGWRR